MNIKKHAEYVHKALMVDHASIPMWLRECDCGLGLPISINKEDVELIRATKFEVDGMTLFKLLIAGRTVMTDTRGDWMPPDPEISRSDEQTLRLAGPGGRIGP